MNRCPSTLLFVVLAAALAPAQEREPAPFDVLVRGGTVADGTGGPRYRADVAVRDGRVAALGELPRAAARRVIDATGLVVAPGFVDAHTHAEAITSRPMAENFLRMGVTTLISGNCGGSKGDLAETFTRLEKGGIGPNWASLVGHGTVREAVMGRAPRAPTPEELEAMREAVRAAMQAGAVGMSTGLIYVPGTYADTDELVALCEVVAEHDGVYATHMRDEADEVLEAIDEALEIARRTGVRVHVSHLKASGKNNWGRSREILARLREARAEGLEVTADQYAYAASSTSLDVLFPSRELSVGRKAFAAKLRDDPEFRARMRDALFRTMDRTGFGDLSYCRIANAPGNRGLNGTTIDRAAARRYGEASREAQARLALELFADSEGRRISMIYHKMSEDDVEAIMRQPWIAVACDAGIRLRGTASKPHPRGAGNNPRVLARYVRERGVLPLELAIHKMTALPARVFRLEDRGVIRPGAWADLVLFDPDRVRDRATFDEPLEPPEGIEAVLVNGVVVLEGGELAGERPGRVLRHAGGTADQAR